MSDVTQEQRRGTMTCPICGLSIPHEHSGFEIGEYRQEQGRQALAQKKLEDEQTRNRDNAKAVIKRAYEKDLSSVHAKYARYLGGACDFCRGLPRGNKELKYNCGELYGLVIDHEKYTAKCPTCGEILAEWE